MVRPRAAITTWSFLVIGLARHAGPTISVDLVWATIALAASYAVATSVNDLADVEIDRANGLHDASRPLATGAASVTDLRWTAASAGAIAVAAAVPLGATGLAQCTELTWQLRGEAEKRQVDGAQLGLQHNIGLGGAAVVTVYRRPE